MWFQVPSVVAPVKPETIFTLMGIEFSNAMLLGLLVSLCVMIFALIYTRKPKMVPSKVQNLIEMSVEGFYTLTEQILGNKSRAEKMLPLIGTIFVFFGISNLIGLIPGVTSFTIDGVPLFRTPTNDFNMTFSVAVAMVLLAQYASLREFGILGHLGKYFKFKEIFVGFKQGIGKGIFAIIDFLIGLLDIISEIAKILSLSLRLFGNMFAGEVLAAILLGAFALAIPTVWLTMNLLVGVLQAMVFGALTAAYYSLAVARFDQEESN